MLTAADPKLRISDGPIEDESPMDGPTNVEITYGPFIGRQVEMHKILKHLLRDKKRLIVVTGPEGVGKTRFIKELARYMVIHTSHKDGVYYVDFETARNANDVSKLLREVGFEKLFG